MTKATINLSYSIKIIITVKIGPLKPYTYINAMMFDKLTIG